MGRIVYFAASWIVGPASYLPSFQMEGEMMEERIGYERTSLSPAEMQMSWPRKVLPLEWKPDRETIFPCPFSALATYIPEKRWPWIRWGQESLCCAPSPHSNLNGSNHVTQDLLANQDLKSDLPLRSGGGCFRVPRSCFKAVAEEAWVVGVTWSVC